MQVIEVGKKKKNKRKGKGKNFWRTDEGSLLFAHEQKHTAWGMQESIKWFEADWKRQTFICTGREEESMR